MEYQDYEQDGGESLFGSDMVKACLQEHQENLKIDFSLPKLDSKLLESLRTAAELEA